MLLNSIYFSAIMHALEMLKKEPDAYDQRWANVIKGKLHNFGWDLKQHEAYTLAQRLMKFYVQLNRVRATILTPYAPEL